jgi:hypothetical protein
MSSAANSKRTSPGYLPSVLVFVIVLLLMFAGFLYGRARGKRGLYPALAAQNHKTELADSLLANLHASAEAEKAAVMAETDEASMAFAEEARRASSTLEHDRNELARLIVAANRAQEVQALEEFDQAWKKYQDLEREVLELAVENTNLKAQRLSFGPAREALAKMESALTQLKETAASTSEAAGTVKVDAAEALVAALKIYALEARHIAEPRDEEMDRIEAEMQELDARVTERLSAPTGSSQKAALDEAAAAYADFQKIHAEILRLSRRNSNVRSAALSLGKKRNATAACRDALKALRESLQDEGPTPTR